MVVTPTDRHVDHATQSAAIARIYSMHANNKTLLENLAQ